MIGFKQTAVSVLTLVFVASASSQVLRSNSDLRLNIDFQRDNIRDFGIENTHVLALTFDDGPGKGTAKILDLLKAYGIKATFFSVGQQAEARPLLVKRIVAEGHILANHSYTHANLAKSIYQTDPTKLVDELRKTHEILRRFQPPGANLYFRAPYSAWSPLNADILNADPVLRNYIGPIFWNVGKEIERDENGRLLNAGDWACWRPLARGGISADECLEGYLAKIESVNGGVVLMHDIHAQTADLLERILPILVSRGYKFVTVDQLTELKRYRTQYPYKPLAPLSASTPI